MRWPQPPSISPPHRLRFRYKEVNALHKWARVDSSFTQIFAAKKFSDRTYLLPLSLRRYNLRLQSLGWTRYDEIRREIK